jgi:cysteine desulfurase family protein
MIYLDNPASTNFKPISVKLAILKALSKKYCSNPGRSSHKLSINSAMKICKTREIIADAFNIKNSNNIIFTGGCTESLNLAIFGSVKKSGHVITTIYEHNSVLRPLVKLQKDNMIELTIITPNKNQEITVQELKKALKPNTYMLAINHTSNVTGYTINLNDIGAFCKNNNLIFLLDAAQSGGHIDINIKKHNINMVALAGHKGFYGPQGVGVLILNNIKLKPLKYGGTGVNSNLLTQPIVLPECYEAGTTCSPLIFGLKAGFLFTKKNKQKIASKNEQLSKYLMEELSKIKNVKLYTKKHYKSGVVSFNLQGVSSLQVANILSDKYKICVRSGLHCAPLVHKHFNTLNQGMVRVGIAYDTKKTNITKLIKAIKQINKQNL